MAHRRRRNSLLAIALAAALAWPVQADHVPAQASQRELAGWVVAPFTLTDQDGRPFTEERLRGRWTFVVFGDTGSCGQPCAAALAAAAGLCQRIAPAEASKTTQVLFVSMDPRRDSGRRLRDYLAPFDARFIGATGAPATLARLADDMGAGVEPGVGAAPPHYRGGLLLVGPDGAIRGEYLPPFDVPRLTAAYLRARLGRF